MRLALHLAALQAKLDSSTPKRRELSHIFPAPLKKKRTKGLKESFLSLSSKPIVRQETKQPCESRRSEVPPQSLPSYSFSPKRASILREDHAANFAPNQEEGFPFPFLRINPQDRCHLRDFHPSYFTTSPGEMVSPYSGQKKHPIPISKYRCIVYHPSGNGR